MPYLVCLTSLYLHLPGPAPAPQAWRFDFLSAMIGAGVAFLLAGLAYTFRDQLTRVWETVIAPLIGVHRFLQTSAEDRYRELIVAQARSLSTLSHVAPLDAVFVEPELLFFLPPPPTSEIDSSLVAPTSLPLGRILGGHSQLLVLGPSGSGKTAALAHLALSCAQAGGENSTKPERLPLYVPLSAIQWEEGKEGGDDEEETDHAAGGGENSQDVKDEKRRSAPKNGEVGKLVDAALAAVGSKSGLAGPLRQYLQAGQALVLLDGWEGLSPQQRQQVATWLAELIAALPGNQWVVGAEARGYGPLTEIGFVPLTLAPWDPRQVETFARQWAETYVPVDEGAPVDPDELIAELRAAARMKSSPLELAVRAFVYLSDGNAPAGRAAVFDRALDLLLWREEEPWLLTPCRTALGQVALQLQQEGRATVSREEIEAAVGTALPPSGERPANAAPQAFRALTGERGLLVPTDSNRYAFAHPLWQAHLAARQLIAVTPDTLIERLEDPRWAEVLRSYAEVGDMKPLVAAWLRRPDDLFRTRLVTVGSWIGAVPEDSGWREGVMAVLARSFLQPGHPQQVRQALAEALAVTGVRGVVYLFKQALRAPDADVRLAAVKGLVRIAQEADLPALEAMLKDDAPTVREATARGLAYMGTDAAARLLEAMVLSGDEVLGPAAAEVLARFREDGAAFLHEAVESGDLMARRAAVAGLALLEARDSLEKMAREDEQWIVRTAAQTALEELEKKKESSGVPPPPEIEQLPWLISWAATQGEGVGLGEVARAMLRRALGEGEPPIRLAAVQILTQVGRLDDVEPLRAALVDSEPVIASAAFEALAEIGRRYDLRIE